MPHPAQKYLDLKSKNIEFFRQRIPGIYQYFSQYVMRQSKVDVLPETNEIDLLEEGKHLYGGRSMAYAKREVATFLSVYDYGSKIKSFRPLDKAAYKNPRLFASAISKVYEEYYKKEREFDGYTLGNFIPLMVFMGVGLGRHIEIMCKIRDIHHVIVYETDMDKFAASLYAVDWQEIVADRLDNDAKSFVFLLAPGANTEQEKYSVLWNKLIEYCPIFPVTTLFYNHLANPVFDRISDLVNQDLLMHLFSFGNYDDEINQLNNAMHNFRRTVKLLPSVEELEPVSRRSLEEVPVCIVGSGPSLDLRIEDLKLLQHKALVISCGSALSALHFHGIKPDLHVELESDYCAYMMQGMMDDKAWLQSIRLIGSAQLNPLMFDLFGEARVFFKRDGVLSGLFSMLGEGIENAAPTCTNAALALTKYYGIKQVFLFGMDFGFPNKQMHHAVGTVYYKKDQSVTMLYDDKDFLSLPGAAGGSVQSTTFLYTAKRRVDMLLSADSKSQVFNCSEGAALAYSRYLSSAEIEQRIAALPELTRRDSLLDGLFSKSKELSIEQLELTAGLFLTQIEHYCLYVQSVLDSSLGNLSLGELTQVCHKLSHQLSGLNASGEGKALYYFIRGTIWHFLLAAYTLVFAIQGESEQRSFIKAWEQIFKEFLNRAIDKTKSTLGASRCLQEDDLVNRSIWSTVLTEVSEWVYQGYSIMPDGRLVYDTVKWEFQGFVFDGQKYRPYPLKSP